jgi:prophage regulatory protein
MPAHGTTSELTPSGDTTLMLFFPSHWLNPMEWKVKQDSFNQRDGQRPTPSALADVAFLDIGDVCAAARMSASWVHEEVRAGRFPQPLRFGPRCTRWRSGDVRAWLVARAAAAEADTETTAAMLANAKKASDAAQAKRRSATLAGGAK